MTGARGGAWLLGLTLLAGCGAGATRTVLREGHFDPPPDTLLTRYVNVPNAVWLGGERWLVVSPEFNEAVLADFGARTLRPLGGRGEAELRNPFTAFRAADTAYVADWALRRVTVWSADGRLLGTVPAADPLRGALPRARDAAGQWYFEVAPLPRADGSGYRDSAAVVRAGPGLARFDTVARLSPLDLAEVDDPSGRRFERRIFSGTDRWGVLPDGTLWLARVYPNRVDWLAPDGSRTRGTALPDRIIEVTTTDLEHWLLQFPEELRSTARRLPWSPFKPPFVEAFTSAANEVWLEKSRPVADSTRRYHVVDRAGRLLSVMVLPIRQGHVIAVSDSLALIAEQYAEGVRLMQAPVPVARVPEP